MLTLPLLLLVYAWALYPLMLAVITRKVSSIRPIVTSVPSPVTILFSAYNEEDSIRARLENLVQLENPRSAIGNLKSEILLGIDGATDRTAAIAGEFGAKYDNLHVLNFKQRRGKVAVLKDLVKKSREVGAAGKEGGLLVFTDANTLFRPDTLTKLLAHFSDPRVGGVCGRLEFKEKAGVKESEGLYWRWETQLKIMESRVDSCLGANGALYAIRSELFWQDIPENTVVDDLVIGMKVREAGFRMVYEPDAVAEEEFPRVRDEWRRRVRIGAGDFQALILCWKCLLPRYREFAWIFWSHKVLRWFTPHLALLMVAVAQILIARNGWLASPLLARAVLIGASCLVVCAEIGGLVRNRPGVGASLFRACNHFVAMNAALFVGSLRFGLGDLKGHWERTPR